MRPRSRPGIGTGITADNQIDVNGNFHTPRIRSGFVPNILAFNLRKNVSESTVLSGRVAPLVRRPFERLGLHQRTDVRARGLPEARRPVGQLHGRAPARPLQPRGDRESTSTTATTTGWDGRATSMVSFRPAGRSATVRCSPSSARASCTRHLRWAAFSSRPARRSDDPGRKVGAFDHADVRGRGRLHAELRRGHVQAVRERRLATARRRRELRRPDTVHAQPASRHARDREQDGRSAGHRRGIPARARAVASRRRPATMARASASTTPRRTRRWRSTSPRMRSTHTTATCGPSGASTGSSRWCSAR